MLTKIKVKINLLLFAHWFLSLFTDFKETDDQLEVTCFKNLKNTLPSLSSYNITNE